MNGIIMVALIMTLAGLIGMAMSMLRIHREYESIVDELSRVTDIISDFKTKTETAAETIAGQTDEIRAIRNECEHDITEMQKKIYGTNDIAEFKRVQTAAYAAQMKADNLEKIIRSMNPKSIQITGKDIQDGLIGIHLADDLRFLNSEKRTSNG